MDCKFNIGDYVYYRGDKPSDIYLVIGRTEYSRKKTIYCGKDRLVHEPTYELINIFYVKDRIIKEIADTYGIPMFSNCREHHMTLKESRVEDINTIPFKFNLNDYVTLKKGSVVYKITSRTEWLDGGNPTYELMRITESEHVYFEYYSEELINEKICVKEVVDNFKKMCYELCEEECKKLEEDMKNMDKFNDISNSIRYQIVGESTEEEKKAAANKIWDICKESPAMGNAVMDLIGSDAYMKIIGYKED